MAWVFVAVGVALMALALVNPRARWRGLSAWRYRDPAANEPSAAAFAVHRAALVGGGLAIVVIGFVINARLSGGQSDIRPEVDRVAAALTAGNPMMLEWAASGYVGDTLNPEDALSTLGEKIEHELNSDVQVSNRVAASAAEYRFTLITNDGEDPHCLRVEVMGDPVVETDTVAVEPGQPPVEYRVGLSATIDTSVTEGAC